MAAFGLIVAVFVMRLLYLDVIVAHEYSTQAKAARTIGITVEAKRGTIYDRNHNVLAISVDATTIYANPSEVDDPRGTAAKIADAIGGEADDYVDKLLDARRQFAYIKRKVDPAVAQSLRDQNLKGVYFLRDSKRSYPYGQVGGQIVGACNEEVNTETQTEYLKGIAGLEYYYDKQLSGTPGYYEAERGADGTPIPGGVHESVPAQNGEDIIVSLDIEMQRALEEKLTSGLAAVGTNSGTAVLMDGGTGEIYAAASLPLFNPADRTTVEEGSTQLKAVSNLLEPGSVFKTVAAMSLLETGSMGPEDTLFAPAVISADGYKVSDAHERGDTVYSLRQVMQYSSNVGIALAVERMGFKPFYDHILKYKLNELSGVDYPGEQSGYLLDYDKWSRVAGYNATFGQGLSMTPLQITRFYAALVNDGSAPTPHFLLRSSGDEAPREWKQTQVVENTDAIAPMTSMLETVVTDGTGKRAAVEGVKVAGKTSTAEIYDEVNGGYLKGVYNLCFAGYLPDSSSRLVCFVGADRVPFDSGVTFIFRDIMSEAVNRYNIVPE
ncbi:penicillin-binding protein 2 [Eggerthellaceae bacterium zg-1084]|uniref:Penicillin-binding protein 2 n=2 Tax=Berryella wangjianweii TaxID=2734634 RepID=A0A6M8J365_9ACTN|nr:penicillin-binding protein 2 [Berryella wangjianweii]NPD33047.1 penicillin-binding protein 2 [Eggerthellaceae bacterium zg-997]QKF08077.1 penicillin-binding protein 2 [Berryella wangjianweii]